MVAYDVCELSQRATRYDNSMRATCNGWAVRSERRQPRTVIQQHITSLTALPNLGAQPTCTSVLHVAAPAAAATHAMPDQRKPPARAHDESCSILYALSDDTLAGVLHAAQAGKVLGQLASSSKYLCRAARSRVPVSLLVYTQEEATHILRSHAAGRPPFSGCVDLFLGPDCMTACLLVVDILGVAQQWPALQSMHVVLHPDPEDVLLGLCMDFVIAPVLSGLPALKQLRRLKLDVADFGPSSARHIGRMGHLVKLELTAGGLAGDPPVDLSPLSGMTSLAELVVRGGPPVQPPAGPEGPYCFPSSLRSLTLDSHQQEQPAPLAPWLTHLPGCPQLQSLHLVYHHQQHASAHPAALVRLLAQHTPQLRNLVLDFGGRALEMDWSMEVVGLPQATIPDDLQGWSPDSGLAALTSLGYLSAGGHLCVRTEGDWEAFAQLPALERVAMAHIYWAPPPQQKPAAALRVLVLEQCTVRLDGHALGLVLLGCPVLQRAGIFLAVPPPSDPTQPPRPPLTPHPTLQELMLYNCAAWGAVAGAEFAALSAAVAGVANIGFGGWPQGAPGSLHGGLPDLSPCTALWSLGLGGSTQAANPALLPEQEDIVGMVASVAQLRHVAIHGAPRVNARCALLLQAVLPRLQLVELSQCGSLMPLAAGAHQHTCDVHQVLAKVRQLLRPGIVLRVSGQVW